MFQHLQTFMIQTCCALGMLGVGLMFVAGVSFWEPQRVEAGHLPLHTPRYNVVFDHARNGRWGEIEEILTARDSSVDVEIAEFVRWLCAASYYCPYADLYIDRLFEAHQDWPYRDRVAQHREILLYRRLLLNFRDDLAIPMSVGASMRRRLYRDALNGGDGKNSQLNSQSTQSTQSQGTNPNNLLAQWRALSLDQRDLKPLSPRELNSWQQAFEVKSPQSNEGRLSQILILDLLHLNDQRDLYVRRYWPSSWMHAALQDSIFARYGQHLTIEDHLARAQIAALQGESDVVTALLPLLPPDHRETLSLRLALKDTDAKIAQNGARKTQLWWQRTSKVTSKVTPKVTSNLSSKAPLHKTIPHTHAGLMLDYAHYLFSQNDHTLALKVLTPLAEAFNQQPNATKAFIFETTPDVALALFQRYKSVAGNLARRLIEKKRYTEALPLLSTIADTLDWKLTYGWLLLRKLKQPEQGMEVLSSFDTKAVKGSAPNGSVSNDVNDVMFDTNDTNGGIDLQDPEYFNGGLLSRFFQSTLWGGAQQNSLLPPQTSQTSTMTELLGSSISRSTHAAGLFWLAQAILENHNPAQPLFEQHNRAKTVLQEACVFQDQLYGQLASEQQGGCSIDTNRQRQRISVSERRAFRKNPIIRLITKIWSTGETAYVRDLLRTVLTQIKTPSHYELFVIFSTELERTGMVIQAATRAKPFPETLIPHLEYPWINLKAPTFDSTLVMSIVRQESGFEPSAISSSGARGLMQIMPGTSAYIASRIGLPNDLNRLLSDVDHNLRFGSYYIDYLLERYNGAIYASVAAYNGGPTNVDSWLSAGTPHDTLSILDWIESIPLNETRHYVKKVMGNHTIYRRMLTRGQTPVAFFIPITTKISGNAK